MGTETLYDGTYSQYLSNALVKLKNPLMGTETRWQTRSILAFVGLVKLKNPLMGTETNYTPTTIVMFNSTS